MWSKLTEYAGSVAEIVAPPSDDEGPAGAGEIGDEIWSRFANMVAPTDAAAPGSSNGKAQKTAVDGEDDEQERYIGELERALLQKKKQNESLEEQIRLLEASQSAGAQSTDQTALVHRLEEQIGKLQADLTAKASEMESHQAAMEKQRQSEAVKHREQIAKLEQRVLELDIQCGVLNASLREHTGNKTSEQQHAGGGEAQAASVFPSLVQAALVLSKTAPHPEPFQVGTTEAEVSTQLQELSQSVASRMEASERQLAQLHASLSSFFELQGEPLVGEGDAFNSNVQTALGLLSHRLAKAATESDELSTLRVQLQSLRDQGEKQSKTIQALQTQLSGVQASKLKHDATLVNREAEMVAAVEKRDRTIANYQASEEKLKQSMAHLGQELEAAHAEADELDQTCRRHQAEIKKLQKQCQQAEELQAAYDQLEAHARELETSAQEYEQGYMQLLRDTEQLKQRNEEEKAELVATTEAHALSSEQQVIYDLQSRLSACEADKAVAVQDAERLHGELEALDKVLLQFRSEHKQQRARVLELEQTLEDTRREIQQQRARAKSDTSSVSEEDFRRVMEVLSQRTQECEQLREALESFGRRFSSKADVLDKQLAAQLVVSYLESEKKHEVLELMARMMDFSDDQKRRAGILGEGQVVIPGNGGGGLFSSILGLNSGASSAEDGSYRRPSADLDNDQAKLGQLWSNFVIEEAKK